MSAMRGLLMNAALAAVALSLGWGCALIAGLQDREVTETGSTSGGGNGGSGAGGTGGSSSNTGGGGSGAGGTCDPGSGPVAVVTGQKRPTVIAADANGVYWATEGTEPGDYGIWKMATPCGPAQQLVLPAQRKPLAIAVDGSNVYWSESGRDAGLNCTGNDPTERERIMRVAKASSSGMGPGDFVYGACGEMDAVALDADRVYWTRSKEHRVQSVQKETSGYLSLWYDPNSTPRGIVAGAGAVYWSDSELQVIQRYDGTLPAEIHVQSADVAWHMAMDGEAIYWTAGSELRSNPRDTPNAATTLSTSINQAAGITTDSTSTVVYVADTGAHSILKIPKDGSAAPEPISTDPSAIGGVALDDTYVYWTQTDTGEIWRAPR